MADIITFGKIIMATINFVTIARDVSHLLPTLRGLSINPPSLYIDLEGTELSRAGTISLLTLYVLPTDTVYLIDIHTLGATAFSTPALTAQSTTSPTTTKISKPKSDTEVSFTLKSILECPITPKIFFDVRNDSDALFAHFGIRLNCIHDLQLMELATRTRNRRFLSSLTKCIEHDTDMTIVQRQHATNIKEQGIKLFAPDKGGSYDVFKERPLNPIVQEYCVQDVVHMPELWRVYHMKMDEFWVVMVKEASDARVAESQSATYQWNGKHKGKGCWEDSGVWKARKQWKKGKKSGLYR
jgi:exonuclease 3'-5' domain-containing protein 1